MKCQRCQDTQWICENHDEKPWPHEWCEGAGMACPDCNPMAKDEQVVRDNDHPRGR